MSSHQVDPYVSDPWQLPEDPTSSIPRSKELAFPVILCVFEQEKDGLHSARLRLEIFMESGIDMYRRSGITDHSVWGIYISGSKAELMLAQYCPQRKESTVRAKNTRHLLTIFFLNRRH